MLHLQLSNIKHADSSAGLFMVYRIYGFVLHYETMVEKT